MTDLVGLHRCPSGCEHDVDSAILRPAGVVGAVIAPVAADGTVCLYSTVQTQLLADLSGWFPSGASGFQKVGPVRVFDTRFGTGGVAVASTGPAGLSRPQCCVVAMEALGVMCDGRAAPYLIGDADDHPCF